MLGGRHQDRPHRVGREAWIALQQQGLAVTQAAGMIYQTFRSQAAILAYMDIFAVCSILAFCVVPVTLLLGSEKAAGGGGH